MKPVVRTAVESAAAALEQHHGVVALALISNGEELRLSARRARDRALHSFARARDKESELSRFIGRALEDDVATPAHWVEHHWAMILAAVCRREAGDLAMAQSDQRWLQQYDGPEDAPVFKIQTWQYEDAVKRAKSLAEVKVALTSVRDALREAGELPARDIAA